MAFPSIKPFASAPIPVSGCQSPSLPVGSTVPHNDFLEERCFLSGLTFSQLVRKFIPHAASPSDENYYFVCKIPQKGGRPDLLCDYFELRQLHLNSHLFLKQNRLLRSDSYLSTLLPEQLSSYHSMMENLREKCVKERYPEVVWSASQKAQLIGFRIINGTNKEVMFDERSICIPISTTREMISICKGNMVGKDGRVFYLPKAHAVPGIDLALEIHRTPMASLPLEGNRQFAVDWEQRCPFTQLSFAELVGRYILITEKILQDLFTRQEPEWFRSSDAPRVYRLIADYLGCEEEHKNQIYFIALMEGLEVNGRNRSIACDYMGAERFYLDQPDRDELYYPVELVTPPAKWSWTKCSGLTIFALQIAQKAEGLVVDRVIRYRTITRPQQLEFLAVAKEDDSCYENSLITQRSLGELTVQGLILGPDFDFAADELPTWVRIQIMTRGGAWNLNHSRANMSAIWVTLNTIKYFQSNPQPLLKKLEDLFTDLRRPIELYHMGTWYLDEWLCRRNESSQLLIMMGEHMIRCLEKVVGFIPKRERINDPLYRFQLYPFQPNEIGEAGKNLCSEETEIDLYKYLAWSYFFSLHLHLKNTPSMLGHEMVMKYLQKGVNHLFNGLKLAALDPETQKRVIIELLRIKDDLDRVLKQLNPLGINEMPASITKEISTINQLSQTMSKLSTISKN